MHKLALAAALAAAVLIPGSCVGSSARADGYRHHHHRHHHLWGRFHHVWGDGDYELVRWSNGDCKLWYDNDGPPIGTDWVELNEEFRTRDAAWQHLVWFQEHGECNR